MEQRKTPVMRRPISDIRRPRQSDDTNPPYSREIKIAPAPAPVSPGPQAPAEPASPAEQPQLPDQPTQEDDKLIPDFKERSDKKSPALLIICSLLIAVGLSAVAIMQYQKSNASDSNVTELMQTESNGSSGASNVNNISNDTTVSPDTPTSSDDNQSDAVQDNPQTVTPDQAQPSSQANQPGQIEPEPAADNGIMQGQGLAPSARPQAN